MPAITIISAQVTARTPSSSSVRVHCWYEGAAYEVLTEIAEGRDIPNTSLVGYAVPPAEEFVVALHEALDEFEDGKLVVAEMRRICE